MYYEHVLKIFNQEKVSFLIAGGMAVNLHGVPRFTADLDLLIDVSSTNLRRLESAIKKSGFKPKIPIPLKAFLNPENWKKWNREKGLLALNLYHPKVPFEQIDLLIHVPLTFKEAQKSQVSFKAGSLRLNVVSIKDLIKMKRKAGRNQDLSDIQALKKIKGKRQ